MSDRFQACLAETLKWEGGWSNHPKDKGGATMRGVIQRVYDGWRDSKGLPRRTVRSIEDHELVDIYYNNYWVQVRGDELPPGIDLAVFDFGVNSGPARAAKFLQRVLRLNQVDGHIGPATIGAAARADPDDVVRRLMADRRSFLQGLSDYAYFGKGWERRCEGVEQVALSLAADHEFIERPPAVEWAEPQVVYGGGRAVESDATTAFSTGEKTAGAGAGIGTGQMGMEAASAAQAATRGGRDFSWLQFALELASRPGFWIGVSVVAGAVMMFVASRRQKWRLS